MRARLSALWMLCTIAAGCAPEDKCNGSLYWDPVVYGCRICPKSSTFKNGTCQCEKSYEFIDSRCVLKDGAIVEEPDAGMPMEGANCAAYCDFAKVCIGDNSLAMSALQDIISGLHADDQAACTSACMSDLGGDGASDPVVACVQAGREEAMCAGMGSQQALTGAMTLVGDCCRPRPSNALCKSICKTLKASPLVSSMVDYCP